MRVRLRLPEESGVAETGKPAGSSVVAAPMEKGWSTPASGLAYAGSKVWLGFKPEHTELIEVTPGVTLMMELTGSVLNVHVVVLYV